jgi:hypothetical protein
VRCSCKPELEGVGDGVRASRDGMEIRWGGDICASDAMGCIVVLQQQLSFHIPNLLYLHMALL